MKELRWVWLFTLSLSLLGWVYDWRGFWHGLATGLNLAVAAVLYLSDRAS